MTDTHTPHRPFRSLFTPGDTTPVPQKNRPDLVYCWSKEIELAVNVALATRRALLLQGEPGVGKSAVAAAVAKQLNWRLYTHSVSSRTEAQDLTWKMDYVRRLAGANEKDLKDDLAYLLPGPFWWGFDIDSAERRGRTGEAAVLTDPSLQITREERSRSGAVVLIDEIDKADPAVANDLLETVGAGRFWVDSVAQPFGVEHKPPDSLDRGGLLMVFTSNNERDMPEPFLRRCIVETMAWPAGLEDASKVDFKDRLKTIAKRNWKRLGTNEPIDPEGAPASELLDGLYEAIWTQRLEHKQRNRRPPGLAEFLDAVSACRELEVNPGTPYWSELKRLVWSKDSVSV